MCSRKFISQPFTHFHPHLSEGVSTGASKHSDDWYRCASLHAGAGGPESFTAQRSERDNCPSQHFYFHRLHFLTFFPLKLRIEFEDEESGEIIIIEEIFISLGEDRFKKVNKVLCVYFRLELYNCILDKNIILIFLNIIIYKYLAFMIVFCRHILLGLFVIFAPS